MLKIPHVLKMGEVSTWLAKGKLMPADLEETLPSCWWTVPPPCNPFSTSSVQHTWWICMHHTEGLVSHGVPQLWNKDVILKLLISAQSAYKLRHRKQNNQKEF